MLDNTEIRNLEILSLRSLPAQVNRYYDGWLMRFNNGYTRRANSVYPIYAQPDDVMATILHCEAEYNSVHQDVHFKMSPVAMPTDLDKMLEDRGYASSEPTFMQIADLGKMDLDAVPVETSTFANETWVDTYIYWMGFDKEKHKAIRHTLTTTPAPAYFCTLHDDRKHPVALGYGIHSEAWYGLFGIVVDPKKRQKGYGEQITQALLRTGHEHGAKFAYLQVESTNTKAISLYEKMGFRTQYDYWYRTRQ
jgi:ribosomal protein S18 acetylase RimI-like enzyme